MRDRKAWDKALADLEWPKVTEALAGLCSTKAGAVRAKQWPVWRPLEQARRTSAEISEARGLLQEGQSPGPETDLDLGPQLAVLAKGGVLDADGLRKVASVLAGAARLRRRLQRLSDRAPGLARRASAIRPLEDVWGPISDSFGPDGKLADEASPELGGLRARARALRERIVDKLKEIMERPHVAKLLQDKYYTLREDRYVLPIKVEMRHEIRGIVHGRSQSGQTVFLEPAEITELGNRLKMALADVELEEARVLAELSALVAEELPSVRSNLDVLAELDSLTAAAKLADRMEAAPVELADGGGLELLDARHPLMVLAGGPVVPNTFELPLGSCLVVTGPNAGGKTVALKTIGLSVLMARSGLHVPCRKGSRVPLYDGLFTSMGDDQDLTKGLSTFTAHVENLKAILEQADEKSLVLLDEVAVGTEPSQGAALAQAVLEALAEAGCSVLVTTHYTALKALAVRDERFRNAAMGYDPERGRPTYRLEMDAMGRSSALETARAVGLPEPVLRRAQELLSGGQAELDELLGELERMRAELEARQAALDAELRRAEEERRKVQELRRSLAQELDRLRRRAHDRAVAELQSLRADLERLRKRLRKAPEPSPEELAQAEKEADEAAARLRELAPPPPEVRGRRPEPGGLQEGQEVLVSSLRAAGVLRHLDGRGRARVLVGSMEVTVPLSDLLLPEGGATAPSKSRRGPRLPASEAGADPGEQPGQAKATGQDEDLAIRAEAETLDLRAKRVDEALDALDAFLDDCLRRQRRIALVIHGHGTGALKRAVREHVRSHPVVQRFRPGRLGEGGDGVTVLFLDV